MGKSLPGKLALSTKLRRAWSCVSSSQIGIFVVSRLSSLHNSAARRRDFRLAAQLRIMRHEVGIHALQALPQRNLRAPTQGVETRYVQKFLRRTVRSRRVKFDCAAEADHIGDQAGKFSNRDVLAGSHVEKLQVRIGFHDEDASIGKIV